MPDARALPIPATQREFTVKVDGQVVSRECQLLVASVTKVVNRIASARLVYLDGAASSSDFPLSNRDTFVPGKAVEVLAGPPSAPISIFNGVVVRTALKVRERSAPQLIVECRHAAFKLTVARKNACFFDQSDADIISSLLDAAGLQADVDTTQVVHKQAVQYRASDWDFLLTRAEANGLFVLTNHDKVEVKKPVLGSSSLTIQFGATLLDLDAQIDARGQYSGVKSLTWDPAQQVVVEREAADPGVSGPGNLSSDDLSQVADADYDLRHSALSEDEAQAWADAQWLHSKLSKVTGSARCEGIATLDPGDTITLGGVGQRFGGDVFVTGVRHDLDTVQGWKTHVQFGGVEGWSAEERPVAAPRAGALLPSAAGLAIGVVASNVDDEGEYRIKVRLPLVDNRGDGVWTRVASLDAGAQRGTFFRPEVGDEVIVGFLDDDPRQPVMLGMLHSSANAAPLEGSDDNHEKVYQSRSKLKLYFNDDKKVVRLETPAGNQLSLSEDDKSVLIQDQNGNKLQLDADGIRIESAKALVLKAATSVELQSSTSLSVKGGTELKLEGSSSAELTSPAVTTVKGSTLLKLN